MGNEKNLPDLTQTLTLQSLTSKEWVIAVDFLTRTGQICSSSRHEFITLSDVLGVSALVDGLNNPNVAAGTPSSILGPFHTDDSPEGTVAYFCCAWLSSSNL